MTDSKRGAVFNLRSAVRQISYKAPIRALLGHFGLDVHRLVTDALRHQLFAVVTLGVDSVIDVGANEGQFAGLLRRGGYVGQILSLEPGSAAYARLLAASRRDPLWTVLNVGAGAAASMEQLIVSRDSVSSSLLPSTARHLTAAPRAQAASVEQVHIHALDSLVPANFTVPWLKVDTQGYEAAVLSGAPKTIGRAAMITLECSLFPVYEGSSTAYELISDLRKHGFEVTQIEPAHVDPATGTALQLDVTFVRGGLQAFENASARG